MRVAIRSDVVVCAFAESYSYDALGRRVSTVNAEGTERHVYDEDWQVIADIDGDGNVIRSYEWGEGIDQLLAVRIGSRTYTALTDIQGTVWGYADGSGAVVARWTYDAWGNVLSEEIADGAEELRSVRYRFHGRERSAATGLVNFRMRWYDPVTGRWLSKDPIGLSGGLNLYAFCDGNPVGVKDTFGLCGGEGGKANQLGKILNFAKNAMKSLLMASQAALPTASSTAVNALEGAASGAALGNGIKALHDAMNLLEAGGLGAGDPGNVLRDSENNVHRNSRALDNVVNME